MAKKEPRKRSDPVRKKKSARKKNPDLPPMPGPFMTEQVLGQLFGSRESDEFDAQQLAYEAMETAGQGDAKRAVKLALQALKLDPDCVDALMLLSQAASESADELIENIQNAVQTGERALGTKFFKENRGHFWGILETRPYMRARAFLAQLLAEAERIDEAIEHYEALLDLNPGDNQGLRYCLLGLYLQAGRLDGAAELFRQFPDEGSAMFAWGRVLERWQCNDHDGAERALSQARKVNRHVEPLLTGRQRMPGQRPDYFSFGDENEAVICVHEIGAAWKRNPQAVAWLKGSAGVG